VIPFDPTLAAIRFGTGLSPRLPPPESVEAMIDAMAGPDQVAREYPIPRFAEATPSFATLRAAIAAQRNVTGAAAEAGLAVYRALQGEARETRTRSFEALIARGARARHPLRERLALFWADHFTVTARNANTRHLVQPFVEEAIRPHLAGRFADMLYAVTTHPMMLLYLDQQSSVGPNSPEGLRRGRGLNENLARELLELHTLGVSAGYSQTDVTELAELLTGLNWQIDTGEVFRPRWAEPGAETVLGRVYPEEASLSTIREVVEALAVHPSTATHMAGKIARHFVSDEPDPALVTHLAEAWTFWQGDLGAVTAALLQHPAAWAPERQKVRRPIEFIIATLRALDVPVEGYGLRNRRKERDLFRRPLAGMAQPWEMPPGPDGWPEAGTAWITPQALATRISWAMQAPARLTQALPDPRAFVDHALGGLASAELRFAAGAAQGRAEGVGLVLASPEFQRR
jgi:uncharacterized protein (DUF1800 family)